MESASFSRISEIISETIFARLQKLILLYKNSIWDNNPQVRPHFYEGVETEVKAECSEPFDYRLII